jgi:hypothetical protein
MGQAKARGTRDQRVAEAIERERLEGLEPSRIYSTRGKYRLAAYFAMSGAFSLAEESSNFYRNEVIYANKQPY